jgi:predicted ATPase
MIDLILIRNFKSLADVKLKLGKFTCLIGMNGSGKSTVLQAVDFISQLMIGRIDEWLAARSWKSADLNCKVRKESNIAIGIQYTTTSGKRLRWTAQFNRTRLQCTRETIKDEQSATLFQLKDQTYFIGDNESRDISFNYQGSLLSALKDSELTTELLELRNALQNIKSLELLSPQLLRKRSRNTDKDIGAGGEKLSAYLDTLPAHTRQALSEKIRAFYPGFVEFKVVSMRSGIKKLMVIEEFDGHKLETEATHLNDGLLRILAMLTQTASNRSLILLDEIENGINQEIIEVLVDTLVHTPHQVLVTTHSPLILNFMTDDIARESVKFLYKSTHGETRIRPFFSVHRISEKLSSMGPGDAFVDTDLRQLARECMTLDLIEAEAEKQGEAKT